MPLRKRDGELSERVVRVEVAAVLPDGPADARKLVGDSASGFIVSDALLKSAGPLMELG